MQELCPIVLHPSTCLSPGPVRAGWPHHLVLFTYSMGPLVPCHVRAHRCSGVAELLVPWSLVAAAARMGLYGRALSQPSFGGVAVGSEPGWLQGFAGL